MTTPSDDAMREEARRAWDEEARRAALPPFSSLSLLGVVVVSGALTLVGVALRMSLLHAGRTGAVVATLAVGLALAALAVVVPLRALLRARARAAAAVASARDERTRGASCPRCGAPLLARAHDEAGARSCGGCGAVLLEAEGLLIAHVSEPRWRELRWRAGARARLAMPARVSWPLSPALLLAWTMAGLGLLWTTAAALGGAPPRIVEAPLALDRQVSMHATARAASGPAALPAGTSTRPRAPLFMGTQVLARRGRGPYHELAVIVRVDGPRAFVVYASGASAWVGPRDLLAPELAEGDAVEVAEGAGFAPATLLERVGEALHVRRADGTRAWTSASAARVRSDAPHTTGEGLADDIPAGAWVEVRDHGVLRPALQVDASADGERALVALSDGSARWVARDDVATQRIGPGVVVWVDGSPEPMIVAARVGHALAVVGSRGDRSWTALSRVRREAP